MTRIGTYAHTEQGYEATNFGDTEQGYEANNFGDYEVKSHEAE